MKVEDIPAAEASVLFPPDSPVESIPAFEGPSPEIAPADAEVIPIDVNPISFSSNIPGEISDLTARIEDYTGEECILDPPNTPTGQSGIVTPKEPVGIFEYKCKCVHTT